MLYEVITYPQLVAQISAITLIWDSSHKSVLVDAGWQEMQALRVGSVIAFALLSLLRCDQ